MEKESIRKLLVKVADDLNKNIDMVVYMNDDEDAVFINTHGALLKLTIDPISKTVSSTSNTDTMIGAKSHNSFIAKNDILPSNSLVTLKSYYDKENIGDSKLYAIAGNNADSCCCNDKGEYCNLFYYIVPENKTFKDHITVHFTEVELVK